MPKVDRCAMLKKGSQQARRRVVAAEVKEKKREAKETKAFQDSEAAAAAALDEEQEQKQGQKQEQETAAVEKHPGWSRETRAAHRSVFVKLAVSSSAGESEGEGEGEFEGEGEGEAAVKAGTWRAAQAVEAVAPPPAQLHQRPNANERGKRSQKGEGQPRSSAAEAESEEHFLTAEQLSVRRQRVLARLLRFLLVGSVIEAWRSWRRSHQDSASSSSRKKAAAGRRPWDLRLLRRKADALGTALPVAFVLLLLFAARFAQEGYRPHDWAEGGQEDFYEVLGVPKDADGPRIRRGYKALALSLHPDKHPHCGEACTARFARVARAYEVLSSPSLRAAYDQERAPEGTISSASSLELSADNFEIKVLRSNEVWFVQIYEPSDGLSMQFHPHWEDAASNLQHAARFGRVSLSSYPGILRHISQRVVLTPCVFRFARAMPLESFSWHYGIEEQQGGGVFRRWLVDSFPVPQRLGGAEALLAWAQEPMRGERLQKIVVSSPLFHPRRGGASFSADALEVLRATRVWIDFAEIVLTDSESASAISGSATPGQGGAYPAAPWVVMPLRSGGSGAAAGVAVGSPAAVESDAQAAAALRQIVSESLFESSPALTVRNADQLCCPDTMSVTAAAERVFCLLIVDAPGAAVADILAQVQASRLAHEEELRSSADSTPPEDDPFRLQPVRLSTTSSRLPWLPASLAGGFMEALRSACGGSSSSLFVLELATRRVAPCKSDNKLLDIFQDIAYEDLHFWELPAEFPLRSGLPDPETSLWRDLISAVSSPLCAFLIYVFISIAAAVLPELDRFAVGASASALLAVLLAVWPLACRRFFEVFWCAWSRHPLCRVSF